MGLTEAEATRISLFQEMTPRERQDVLSLLEQEQYSKGDVILREGKSVQMLWIITRGRCEVVKLMKNGAEQELAELESGAVFGEMSFFNPAPHSASVRAATDVEVMRLSREQFNRLEQEGSSAAHRVALNTAKVLAERLRKMDDWICELVERPDGVKHREEWREFRQRLYTDWQF